MLSINTNLSSLIAQNSMKTSTNKLNEAIERMSTGYKINHAKDNAANYSISTNMTTRMSAYQVAEDNVAMGMDMVTTAEESLSQIQDKLQRLRMLQEQASNGTYGEQSLKAINSEVNALVDEIERLYSTAEYNGIKLFEAQKEEASFITAVTKRNTDTLTKLSTITDATQPLAVDTYSISTPEELVMLAEITNNGNLTSGCEFVLANNIDLSKISNWKPIGNFLIDTDGDDVPDTEDFTKAFVGTFDGNGYEITGMNCSSYFAGLFGAIAGEGTTIKNLGVEGNINANMCAGMLVAFTSGDLDTGDVANIYIDNCYTRGSINVVNYDPDSGAAAGGLLCTSMGGRNNIKNSFSTVDISCSGHTVSAAGLFVSGWALIDIENSYYAGNINAHATDYLNVGGIVGAANCDESEGQKISNTHFLGKINASCDNESNFNVASIATSTSYTNCVENCFYNVSDNPNIEAIGDNKTQDVTGKIRQEIEKILPNYVPPQAVNIDLQVGVYGTNESSLGLEVSFILEDLYKLRNIGLGDNSCLTQIDKMLNTVSAKQTEFGAITNRLESVLEEIGIQYDNLASSRSTIRDADMAELSSTYIQQQILQQAAATLMSTANQSPAIALQLI